MLAVRGGGSQIVTALRSLVPDEYIAAIPRNVGMPTHWDRYLFCAGLLRPKRWAEQSYDEQQEGLSVNFKNVVENCDNILEANERARICVIGSESAYRGSYDGLYASAKFLLHNYVEEKKLKPDQQLICISPGVIEDCGMHTRRTDKDKCEARRLAHPKKRFLKALDVAKLIHFALYVNDGSLTSVVLRLNGGEHNA